MIIIKILLLQLEKVEKINMMSMILNSWNRRNKWSKRLPRPCISQNSPTLSSLITSWLSVRMLSRSITVASSPSASMLVRLWLSKSSEFILTKSATRSLWFVIFAVRHLEDLGPNTTSALGCIDVDLMSKMKKSRPSMKKLLKEIMLSQLWRTRKLQERWLESNVTELNRLWTWELADLKTLRKETQSWRVESLT